MTDILIRRDETDFPGGPVVETLPASAGDRGDPGSGETPRAAEPLSPRTTPPAAGSELGSKRSRSGEELERRWRAAPAPCR